MSKKRNDGRARLLFLKRELDDVARVAEELQDSMMRWIEDEECQTFAMDSESETEEFVYRSIHEAYCGLLRSREKIVAEHSLSRRETLRRA